MTIKEILEELLTAIRCNNMNFNFTERDRNALKEQNISQATAKLKALMLECPKSVEFAKVIYQNLPVNYDGTNLEEAHKVIEKMADACRDLVLSDIKQKVEQL